MALQDIEGFVVDYYELLHSQDLGLFDRLFHPAASLFNCDGTTVKTLSLQDYRRVLEGRKSPAELGHARSGKVVGVDLLSPVMAVVRVEGVLFGNLLRDHLNIVRANGAWQIVAMTYTVVGPA